MKGNLIEETGIELLKRGFTVKYMAGCFDIVARKDARIIIIKILQDANSIDEQSAQEMKSMSSIIGASPLIIAEKAGDLLENNVVYSRFGLYTLNFSTLKECLLDKMPFVKRNKAGLCAHILGDILKDKRKEKGYSLAELSRKLGVSRSMILKYESEKSEISLNKALIMHEIFGDKIFDKIDILSLDNSLPQEAKGKIPEKFTDLGFQSVETKKTPFDIIARKEKEIIFTEVGDKINPMLKSLTQLLDADSLIIFNKKRPKEVPALTRKEFFDFESAQELIKFLRDF